MLDQSLLLERLKAIESARTSQQASNLFMRFPHFSQVETQVKIIRNSADLKLYFSASILASPRFSSCSFATKTSYEYFAGPFSIMTVHKINLFFKYFSKLYFFVWIVLVCSCIDDVTDDEREPLKSFVQLVDNNVKHVENVLRDRFSVVYFPTASSGRLFSRAANDISIK